MCKNRMIIIKNKQSIVKMARAGQELAQIFEILKDFVKSGVTTINIDTLIAQELKKRDMISKTVGYRGYKYSSCISVNDEVVHGVPSASRVLQDGDLVKIDVCASWNGYCADMARCFFVSDVVDINVRKLVDVTYEALNVGIAQAIPGRHLSDISAAIQAVIEKNGFGVVRDFAGHGIGKAMHEEPELPNFGQPGKGPILRSGMALAIEPMVTAGKYEVFVAEDGWTVKTQDHSWAAHVEDTVLITEQGPRVLTR